MNGVAGRKVSSHPPNPRRTNEYRGWPESASGRGGHGVASLYGQTASVKTKPNMPRKFADNLRGRLQSLRQIDAGELEFMPRLGRRCHAGEVLPTPLHGGDVMDISSDVDEEQMSI
jgi:hypothetical protein